MTTVQFIEHQNTYKISITGHSGYGEKGSDIVCAAVSMLTFTLINAIFTEEEKGNVSAKSIRYGQGNAKIALLIAKGKGAELRAVISAIKGGFELLANSYSQYVQIQK